MPPKRQKKPPTAPWLRGVVRILLIHSRFIVDFAYAPELVALVKKIPGYRFDGTTKLWSIPPASLTQLETLLIESKFQFARLFLKEDIELVTKATNDDRHAAFAEIKKNPFEVTLRTLGLVGPEVIICGVPPSSGLRVVTPLRTLGAKLLESLPGVSFIGNESLHFIPAEQVVTFCKLLRDSEISFGIEESVGRSLKSSAALRASALEGTRMLARAELEASRLVPVIDWEQATHSFTLHDFTKEQLKQAFPQLTRKRTFKISASELFQFSFTQPRLPFHIWLTDTAHEMQERSRQVDHEGVPTAQHSIIFSIDENEDISLLASKKVIPNLSRALSERLAETHDPAWYAATFSDEGFLELWHTMKGTESISQSEAFSRRVNDLENRERAKSQTKSFRQALDFKVSSSVLETSGVAAKLYPHQRVGVEFLIATDRAFLGDDMGLGKTLTVLSTFYALQTAGKLDLLLVLCPASLVGNWRREAQAWFPMLAVASLVGSRVEKSWLLRLLNKSMLATSVLIVNYEGARLSYVLEGLQQLLEDKKTLICLDESQRVKNAQSKTFQALKVLVPKAKRRVLLSGTPTPRDITDLWAQMYLLDDGERYGRNFFRWLNRIAELGTKFSDYSVKRFKAHRVKEALGRLDELLLRRKKEDVVSLPEKTFTHRYIQLSGDQESRYEEVREALLLRTTSQSGEEFTREIASILEEYLRAVQIASNPRLVDPAWVGEPAKFLELDDIVKEVVVESGRKLVIWTNYLLNVTELCERYKAYGIKPFSGEVKPEIRTKTVAEFQSDSELKILVAIPAAGGVGITLTAADTAVYIDKTWNGEHWMQSIDRIHRIGQKGTVTIISLLASRVDEMIHRNVERKREFQATVFSDSKSSRQESGGDRAPTMVQLREAVQMSEEAYQKVIATSVQGLATELKAVS